MEDQGQMTQDRLPKTDNPGLRTEDQGARIGLRTDNWGSRIKASLE